MIILFTPWHTVFTADVAEPSMIIIITTIITIINRHFPPPPPPPCLLLHDHFEAL